MGTTKDVKVETVRMWGLVVNGSGGEEQVDEEIWIFASMSSTWVRNVGE